MKILRKEAIIELQSATIGIMTRLDPFRSCLTCSNFIEKTEICKIANGQRPPARIIVYGCSAYDDIQEVPF